MVSVIHMFEELDIAEHVVTHKDSRGKPTWTETVLAQPSYGMVTLTDADGKSKTTPQVVLFYPSKTALTNYQGLATRTLDYYVTQVANVLSDKNGNPTATEISTVSETVSLSTVFDGKGVAIKTKTDLVPMSLTTTIVVSPTPKAPPSSTSSKDLHIVPISDGKYFLGLMLPTFIAILVSIPIRIIDRNAKLYQPFHDLATPRGVQARDSLCVQTADIWSFRARIRSLLNGQVLLTLTGLLLLGSVILIPLSSEAVRIILTGPNCAASKLETLTCKMALGVHTVPAQIAVALLIFMTALAGAIALVLRNWRTGLDWNPWSLVRMAQLGANNEIRNLLLRRLREKNGRITNKAVNKALAGIPFVLDFWKDNEELKYSILIPNEAYSKKDAKSVTFKKGKAQRLRKHGDALPFFILTWTGKLLFLALLCTVQVGLLTYNIAGEGIDYSEFMLGRWRAVRFIFTLAGVLISLMWGSLFYAVSFLSPHKLLRRIRLYNGEAAHMTPPTNPFSGLRSSLSPGRRDLYLGLVSATAILSEVLPLLLSVALDKCTESFWANTVCLWMAVSVLSIMIFMVAGSFFVTWPHMPIDPSTIAGGMYYCLRDLVSMSPSSGLLLGRASPNLV
ncbi:hypothetical protein GGR52DRAFT_578037 [Hypoxylon sp. FL1284]|nr:hypothetical protein GGR52DRAFT_578037 [Hypoxylon sp. FL1284]